MKRRGYIIYLGFASLVVGIYMRIQLNELIDDRADVAIHVMREAAQIPFATLMILVGLWGMIIGFINFSSSKALSWTLAIMSGLWLAYLVTFIIMDFHFNRPIKLSTVMIGLFFLQTLFESYYGGGTP